LIIAPSLTVAVKKPFISSILKEFKCESEKMDHLSQDDILTAIAHLSLATFPFCDILQLPDNKLIWYYFQIRDSSVLFDPLPGIGPWNDIMCNSSISVSEGMA